MKKAAVVSPFFPPFTKLAEEWMVVNVMDLKRILRRSLYGFAFLIVIR